MPYEYFEHQADIGIRGKGKTLAEAFEQAALAMFEIMVETKDLKIDQPQLVEVEGNDLNELLIAWLSELLFLKDVEGKMFSKFTIESIDKNKLVAKIYGEPIDSSRHKLKLEVKAATYTQLFIEKKDNYWIAQCLVDV
ncbi:MAG: archease [Candidatus Heimdallarchaeota archaeon]|nr:MAG: archease [Candidatus Heimdallarchaeota archaeon]